MIHYHGGPITPETCALRAWKGRHAFISFWDSRQIGLAAEVCQSFALDNGAFTAWKKGVVIDWSEYFAWVEKWRFHPGFDFAVVPDVIGGSEDENDLLAETWPFPKHQAAVVWHTNESVERLVRLAKTWPRVAIGSSGEFDVGRNPEAYVARLTKVLRPICNSLGQPEVKLHALRVLNPVVFSCLPFASGDATTVARNIGIDKRWTGSYAPMTKESRADLLVGRIEHFNSSPDVSCWRTEYDISEMLA